MSPHEIVDKSVRYVNFAPSFNNWGHTKQGEEPSEESSEEEEEEVQCVDLEPVANIDELFDDFKGQLFLILFFFFGIWTYNLAFHFNWNATTLDKKYIRNKNAREGISMVSNWKN